MRTWVVGAIILSVSLALSGWAKGHAGTPKKLPDAEISKLLTGKWAVEYDDGNGPKVKGLNHYKKDGTLDATGTVTVGEKSLEIAISGTWKVLDGTIIATVTKTNVPELIKEGHISKDQVLLIDEKLLKFKGENGKERVHKRVNE